MKNKEITGRTMQDIGMCILLGALLVSAIVLANGGTELYAENLIMLLGIFISVLFAGFRLVSAAIVIACIETVSFAAFKIYLFFVTGEQIKGSSYFWILLPGLAVAGIVLFVNGIKKLQLERDVLEKQVEELVMIDPLTGFYNLRSMFMDIQTQISYAERNKNAVSLMILKLRYDRELQSVLKKQQYNEVILRLAKYVYDTVRLEDRVYSIDREGSLGIILTCNKKGTELVEGRIRERLSHPQAFAGIATSPIRVEVKIGCLEYKKAEFQRDAKLFKKQVEEEVEYDI
ncbi:MAG TPA: diguanylate cyclase [Lachnospiraceae bacterium]|nr:diguanylate cyclase [Lachnospiraceae bacterium]